MIKNKNKNKVMIVGIIVLTIVMITGVSFALWQITLQQSSTNVVNTACFKINFTDENEINLQNAYPMSDESGMKLTPYTFTIENICSTTATYQINLEEMETELKRLNNQYVKVSFNNSKGKLLNSYEEVSTTLNDADTSHKLTTGVLKSSEIKSFDLRLWMDEDTPAIDEVMNANFLSKITIIAIQKEGLPEVEIVASDNLNEITVDISTVENPKNETLTYFYQLNEETEIESEENIYTFTNLSDGKYKARGRAETLDGIILEEKELDVTIAYETVYISNTGNDETGNGCIESPYASLQPAYNKVKSGGEMILLSDITATETTNMNIENKEVTLRSAGEDIYTVIKDNSLTTMILDINNSNTLTTTNITFDGNNVISSGALIESHDSTLNLNDGTTVQNNNNRGKYYEEFSGFGALGGGLFIYQSTLNINGANIIYNKTSAQSGNWAQGGGIYFSRGTLNLNSGSVSYNENAASIVNQFGGGIYFFGGGTINMNGGAISNNKTPKQGGGIDISTVDVNVTMNMNGGTISNNVVIQNSDGGAGGGISAGCERGATSSTTVYIKGGIIDNNTAPTGPNTYAYNGAQIIDER